MSPFETVLVVFAALLAAAALAVVYRMIVVPTILDRALATDSLVTLVVMGMALYAAQSRAAWAGPAMLGLTGLAFIGTVTFARFVAREDPGRGFLGRRGEEPPTDTAPHEAIHADPVSGSTPEDGPENVFDSAPEDRPRGEGDPWGEDDPVEDPDHPGEPDPDGPPDPAAAGFGDEGRPRWPDEPAEEER